MDFDIAADTTYLMGLVWLNQLPESSVVLSFRYYLGTIYQHVGCGARYWSIVKIATGPRLMRLQTKRAQSFREYFTL
jgi:hypothetical protein